MRPPFGHPSWPLTLFAHFQWIISDAINKWNTLAAEYDHLNPKTLSQEIIKPAVLGLNHLIDGGGLGDFQSAPDDARILPKSHNRAFLEDIRQGFKAVFWDKAADSFGEGTPSKAASWKLEASKAAIGAKMGFPRS